MSSSSDRPVLIIDAMNLFVRSWAAYPSMSTHGYQMGGCIGFLKTLKRIVLELQPKGVYIAWEGGGSTRRRQIYPEYKLGRKPEKLNRFYGDDIPESEENKKYQILSLLAMLKKVPACQVYVPDVEGDDIIAYLCCGPLKDERKVIVSSDRDIYQLLDDRTTQYSLHKKRCITREDVFEEFRVTTLNFALAKSLCGDSGDNVPGIKGLGFKKVAKLFPTLGTDARLMLQDVFDYCHAHKDESKMYDRVIECKEDVKRNWRLVMLNGNMIAPNQASRIDNVLKTFQPKASKIDFIRLLMKDGINDFDVDDFFFAFHCIDRMSYNT